MKFKVVDEQLIRHFDIQSKGDESKYVKLKANSAQLRLRNLMADLQASKRLIRIISVKARRVGFSRYFDAVGVAFMFTYPRIKGRLMAQLDSTAEELMESIAIMRGCLPYPHQLKWDLGQTAPSRLVFPHPQGASILQSFTARTPGSGRGSGISFLHLTEAAHYPINSPFSAILPTVQPNKNTMIAIESTANGKLGKGQKFYEYWTNAADISQKSHNDFVRFFVPWMEDPYSRADPSIAADAPIDDEERILLKSGVDRAQLAWRRRSIATDFGGRIQGFMEENPSSPEEAFISTGMPAFTTEEQHIVSLSVKKPVEQGELILDGNKVKFLPRTEWPLVFWEMPKPGNEYYIGWDSARGFDVDRPDAPPGDFAAGVVWNGTTGEMAARFMDRANTRVQASILNALGRYYCTQEISQRHYAMLAIELTGNLGLEVQARLREEYQYPLDRFYYWRGRDDKVTKRRGFSIGWETNSRTRDLMFANFRTGIRDKACVIRDEVCASQIAGATMLESGWNVRRGHDDVMVASMIAWTARIQWPPRKISDRLSIPEKKVSLITVEAPFHINRDVWQARRDDFEKLWVKASEKKDPLEGQFQFNRPNAITGDF